MCVLDVSLTADEEDVALLLGVFLVALASASGAALLLGVFLPVLTGAKRSSSDSDDETEALLFVFGLLPICLHRASERGAGELVPLMGMAGVMKGLSFEAVP